MVCPCGCPRRYKRQKWVVTAGHPAVATAAPGRAGRGWTSPASPATNTHRDAPPLQGSDPGLDAVALSPPSNEGRSPGRQGPATTSATLSRRRRPTLRQLGCSSGRHIHCAIVAKCRTAWAGGRGVLGHEEQRGRGAGGLSGLLFGQKSRLSPTPTSWLPLPLFVQKSHYPDSAAGRVLWAGGSSSSRHVCPLPRPMWPPEAGHPTSLHEQPT